MAWPASQRPGPSRPAAENDSFCRALNLHWGYGSFRPGQEEIVRTLAAGRDACVVMPTGGGKSLCYQLPAVLDPGRTAVVVSPLIALMQDQVSQLEQMGIPAAFLNSVMTREQRALTLERARRGAYRLLYLSPERIAVDDTPEWLGRVPVSFFAIDEAHCISEWGHDFRPEYRQLSRLRELFPRHPIAAFTASATQRVRHDIIEQLRLRDPYKHIASFRRTNLRHIIRPCDLKTQESLLLRAVRQVREGSIIAYAPTIARVGQTVAFLRANGISAAAYHGQMEPDRRRENQEQWMADEVRVMVGTMAFGLGINKASVRSVLHLSLPRSIEQYYQEAGRAGRDGSPADCFLFWQNKDAGLHAFFNGQIIDPAERERAWQRFREVRAFVESADCRQLQICRHFGEQPRWSRCENCDSCGAATDWAPLPGHPAGRNRRRGRAPRPARGSRAASFAAPALTPQEMKLKESLRQWRRKAARDQGLPAFIVLHDATLDQLCAARPASRAELGRISGFGEHKIQRYGQEVLDVLGRFTRAAPSKPLLAPGSKPEEHPRPVPEEPCQATPPAGNCGQL